MEPKRAIILAFFAFCPSLWAREAAFKSAWRGVEQASHQAGSLQNLLTESVNRNMYQLELQKAGLDRRECGGGIASQMVEIEKVSRTFAPLNERLWATQPQQGKDYKGVQSAQNWSVGRVPRAWHSVWLWSNPEGCMPRACTDRDKLLLDRFTPALEGAQVYALSQNGRFTRSHLAVVPVRLSGRSGSLVVINGPPGHWTAPVKTPSGRPLPLLTVFLQEFGRSRQNEVLALLQPRSDRQGAYVARQVARDGRVAKQFWPLDSLVLADPQAPMLRQALALPCQSAGGDRQMAQSPVGGVASGLAGANALGAGGGLGVNINPPAGSVGGPPPGSAAGLSPAGNASRSLQAAGRGPLDRSTGGARVANAQRISGTPWAPVDPGEFEPRVSARGPASVPSAVTPQGASVPAGLRATPSRGGGPPEPTIVINQSLQNESTASNTNGPVESGPVVLAPGAGRGESMIRDAIQAGRSALESGKEVPTEVFRDLIEGLAKAKDPAAKEDAKAEFARFYHKSADPLAGYNQLLSKNQLNAEATQEIVDRLNSDVCTHCPDCEYCRALRSQLKAGGAP